jgi:hypothetical protein
MLTLLLIVPSTLSIGPLLIPQSIRDLRDLHENKGFRVKLRSRNITFAGSQGRCNGESVESGSFVSQRRELQNAFQCVGMRYR